MAVHIYHKRPSTSASALASQLRCTHGVLGYRPTGAKVLNWGEPSGVAEALNQSFVNKLIQLEKLRAAGVPTLLTSRATACLQTGVWYPRTLSHHEGIDILKCLRGEEAPAYYTKYEPTTQEVRYHIFRGASIRCGIKQAIHPMASHPHIRSHRNGWNILYGAAALNGLTRQVRDASRNAAKNAVNALGLDFGAVDVGIRADGSPVVFEVNTAPGIEGRTLELYAENIARWAGR